MKTLIWIMLMRLVLIKFTAFVDVCGTNPLFQAFREIPQMRPDSSLTSGKFKCSVSYNTQTPGGCNSTHTHRGRDKYVDV